MIDPQNPGRAYLIGAGPGDPELITVKGARLLAEAEVVLYDRLVSETLLDLVPDSALRIFVGKRCGKASVTQAEINRLMVHHAQEGRCVIRLKGGDPFVFGRGGEECLELVRHGIEFEVVPGISSALAVPAYAGIPVTQRNVATGFTVVSGHLHGASDAYDWRALSSSSTLIVLMGLGNLSHIADRLIEAGKPADTPAAVIQSGTGDRQTTVTGRLERIASLACDLEPPCVIVIGEVAAYHERMRWFAGERAGAARPVG